jgi:hypothetical protein
VTRREPDLRAAGRAHREGEAALANLPARDGALGTAGVAVVQQSRSLPARVHAELAAAIDRAEHADPTSGDAA